jgi:hypothetical protein
MNNPNGAGIKSTPQKSGLASDLVLLIIRFIRAGLLPEETRGELARNGRLGCHSLEEPEREFAA